MNNKLCKIFDYESIQLDLSVKYYLRNTAIYNYYKNTINMQNYIHGEHNGL